MNHVNELLKFSTPPCNEPRHIRLKEYKEEASKMIQEINSALTSCSEFSLGDLEILYVKAVDLPIHIKEIEQLNLKLSAVKLPARQEPVLDSSKYTAADVRITDQKLRVCDICGAFLSVYDSDRRLADHFGGKLHLGYMLIREKLAELQEEREKKRKAYEEEKRSRDQKSQDQERGSSKDRDRGDRKDYDHRNRDRDRNYGRNRGGGDRERVRERESSRGYDSRSHRRSRSRSRERSRDYDRNRRRDRN